MSRPLSSLLPSVRRLANPIAASRDLFAAASCRAPVRVAGAPRAASSVAVPPSGVTLRYFDSRGRAQALRYALLDAGVDFKDDKIAISHIISGNWFNMKNNAAVSGLWGTLPVLEWGDLQVCQTEAIAGFLSKTLGLDPTDEPETTAMSASLTSLAHQDLIMLCLQLVNMVGMMQQAKDEELAQNVQGVQVRLNAFIPRVELLAAQRAAQGGYLVLERPTMGDYFIFEAMEVVSLVLGAEVLNPYPNLLRFMDKMRARTALAAYIESGQRPLTLTGSPHEPAVIQKLHSLPKL